MGELTDYFAQNEKADPAEDRLSLLALTANTKSSELLDSKISNNSALSRMGSVYADTLSQVPGKLFSTISGDLQNDATGTALKVGIAGGIGLGSAILLARSPVAAKTILSGLGFASGIVAADSTIRFSVDAASAKTDLARRHLSDAGSSSLARLGADLIETAPAMVAGARLGLRISPKFDSLNRLANSVQTQVEFPLRQVVPEKLHFAGSDTRTITAANSESGVNLFRAAEDLAKSTPWRGVEDARILKISGNDVRASARLPGRQHETFLGSRKDMAFHTHESELLPTSGDFLSVRKGGIVSVQKEGLLVFHEGKAAQAEEILQLSKTGSKRAADALHLRLESDTMATLIVDPKKELAVGVNLRWSGAENRMMVVDAKPVNYGDAVNNLSRFSGRLNIEALESPTRLLTKPGMPQLLQKIRGY